MANLLLRLLAEEPDVALVGNADNARTALAEIESRRPDLLILDLALREGSGFDVLERLQAQHRPRPAAVVLSNLTSSYYRERAAELGAAGFFDKSRDIALMLAHVRRLARRRAAS